MKNKMEMEMEMERKWSEATFAFTGVELVKVLKHFAREACAQAGLPTVEEFVAVDHATLSAEESAELCDAVALVGKIASLSVAKKYVTDTAFATAPYSRYDAATDSYTIPFDE